MGEKLLEHELQVVGFLSNFRQLLTLEQRLPEMVVPVHVEVQDKLDGGTGVFQRGLVHFVLHHDLVDVLHFFLDKVFEQKRQTLPLHLLSVKAEVQHTPSPHPEHGSTHPGHVHN